MKNHRPILVLAGTWIVLAVLSLPLASPYFRPWEVVHDELTRRFLPNQQVEMTEIGDLGYKSWVRALQHPRPTRFTTDAFGNRSTPYARSPSIVILGDSFAVGSGLSDEQTLAARLTVLTGSVAYTTTDLPGDFFADPRFLASPPKTLIYAPVGRTIRPLSLAPRPRKRSRDLVEALDRSASDLLERWNRDNRLVRTFRFTFQGLRYELLGHPQAVVTAEGQTALALPMLDQGLFVNVTDREAPKVISTIVSIDREAKARGLRFVFMPIPESGTIYPELFPEADQRDACVPSLLDVLLSRLPAEGVQVIDLRSTFGAHKSPYLFQLDDTHWNARAVDLAASALRQSLGGL